MLDLFNRRGKISEEIISTNYFYLASQQMFEDKLQEIFSLPYWVIDTETTGLDCHVDKVILVQIGNKDIQYLIDTRYVNIQVLKDKLEDESFRKYGQNLKFDHKMIHTNFGIRMEGTYDIMIAEQILTAGVQAFGFNMALLGKKHLGIVIDKEMQQSFVGHKGPFTPKQLKYAALDCVYPDMIMRKQIKYLQEQALTETFRLESNALPAFAEMETYGLLLNKEAWLENLKEETKKKEEAREDFLHFAYSYVDPDLFGNPGINPSSSEQVLELLLQIYPEDDLKDRDGKLGTGAEILQKICRKYKNPDLVTSLLRYRKHEKNAGTYGLSYTDHIHHKTKRFHPEIWQIGTETGRPSGKRPNMLNIPAKACYRNPWTAGPRRKILNNDYGACELRIMASMSGDPVMCKGFNDGVDYHTYTASQFVLDMEPYLREFIPSEEPGKGELGDYILDAEGKKQANPGYKQLIPYDRVLSKQRKVAKTINFGLAYGMGAKKLADTLNISIDEARVYMQKFNETFAVLVAWLKGEQEKALERLYSETYLGRKRYFKKPVYPAWEDSWNFIQFNPENSFDENMPLPLKKYHIRRASIKREGGNHPIQGGNADITKIAMYKLRKWIRNYEKEHHDGQYIAHIALQVYDELLVDCPEELSEMFGQKMDEIMKEAGKEVILKVPVATGCIIADTWVKG